MDMHGGGSGEVSLRYAASYSPKLSASEDACRAESQRGPSWEITGLCSFTGSVPAPGTAVGLILRTTQSSPSRAGIHSKHVRLLSSGIHSKHPAA